MSKRAGRAYLFIRWSGGPSLTRLGDIGWAFENVDTQGRFYCFHYGAMDGRAFSTEKCFDVLELIKAMSPKGPGQPGFDEVKVFPVADADPDAALRATQNRLHPPANPLEDIRQVLAAYGVKGLISSHAFSAPFLWYNILPGRSVPIGKLAIHLFELKADKKIEKTLSADELEAAVRKASERISGVNSVGECLIAPIAAGFLVGVDIFVDPEMRVAASGEVASRVVEAVRGLNLEFRHILVQVLPDEKKI